MKYFGIKIIKYEQNGAGPGSKRRKIWHQKLCDKPYLNERFNFITTQRPDVLKNIKVPFSLIDKEIKLMAIYYELAKERVNEYRDYA